MNINIETSFLFSDIISQNDEIKILDYIKYLFNNISIIIEKDIFYQCEEDLYFALENDIISGAAIDVLTTEPMIEKCVLMNAKNCIITPHIACAPVETRRRLMSIVENNIKCFLDGNPINKVV